MDLTTPNTKTKDARQFASPPYGLWRRDVAQLMRETKMFWPQRAGTDHWSTLHHHAAGLPTMSAGLPTMTPRGMVNYAADKQILHAVNMLCQDIAKKVRNWEAARPYSTSR